MKFSEVIWRGWYRIRGRRKPSVNIDVFGPLMTGLLATMLPSHRIVSDLIGLGGELTESLEQQMIDAHVEHIANNYQPAFNAFMLPSQVVFYGSGSSSVDDTESIGSQRPTPWYFNTLDGAKATTDPESGEDIHER
jgi:hypothetical protein